MKRKLLLISLFLLGIGLSFITGVLFDIVYCQKETPKDTIKLSNHSITLPADSSRTLSFVFDKDFYDTNGHLYAIEWTIRFISKDSFRLEIDSADSWNCKHPSCKRGVIKQILPEIQCQRRKKESKNQDRPVYQVSEENGSNYTPIQKEVIAKYHRGEELDFVEGEIFWDLLREQYDR